MTGATVHKTPEGEAAYRRLLALRCLFDLTSEAQGRHDARVAERVRTVDLRRVGFVRGHFLEAGFGELQVRMLCTPSLSGNPW